MHKKLLIGRISQQCVYDSLGFFRVPESRKVLAISLAGHVKCFSVNYFIDAQKVQQQNEKNILISLLPGASGISGEVVKVVSRKMRVAHYRFF